MQQLLKCLYVTLNVTVFLVHSFDVKGLFVVIAGT